MDAFFEGEMSRGAFIFDHWRRMVSCDDEIGIVMMAMSR